MQLSVAKSIAVCEASSDAVSAAAAAVTPTSESMARKKQFVVNDFDDDFGGPMDTSNSVSDTVPTL